MSAGSDVEVVSLRGLLQRLMYAASEVESGRQLHNSRKPDQKIEGYVWNQMNAAISDAHAYLSTPQGVPHD